MYKVDVSALYQQLDLADQESYVELYQSIKKLRERSKKRDVDAMRKKKVYMVSSSEGSHGAVFELFPHQIRIFEELQLDVEWWLLSVPDATRKQRYHELTRKIVNFVYGRNPLKQSVKFGEEEQTFFEDAVREGSQPLLRRLQRGDIVIVHDPHPLPLIAEIRQQFTSAEVPCLWRCHIGLDFETDETKVVWDFLRPYIERYDVTIFPLQEYAKPFCRNTRILQTAIHPTSDRNRALTPTEVREILIQAGLLKEETEWLYSERFPDLAQVYNPSGSSTASTRTASGNAQTLQLLQSQSPIGKAMAAVSAASQQSGGGSGSNQPPAPRISDGGSVYLRDFVVLRDTADCADFGLTQRPYVLQFGNWSTAKGFVELLDGFAELKRSPEKYVDATNSQQVRFVKNLGLVLAGVNPKYDDIEGQDVVEQVIARVAAERDLLAHDVLVVLLSDKNRQNLALTVNALQTQAFAVVQNSLREGSGLSVIEAMWKNVPCIVANASGLRHLITDQESGVVYKDATDKVQIAESIARVVCATPRQRRQWAARARQRVAKEFLMYQQLSLYLDYIRDAKVLARGGTVNADGRPAAVLQRRDSVENRYIARMDVLNLLVNNRKYVEKMLKKDAQFFSRLSNVQTPEYLYIGCADSRVPANEILGLLPGEVFVHRNIAGLVVQSDFNMLSVLHYAVEYLRVKHIIICGHYNCGGVRSTMLREQNLGIFQNWTKHIVDLHHFYQEELDGLPESRLLQKLCELNVMWQVKNVCQTTIVQGAWDRKATLHVHGLIYDVQDGLLLDMGMHIDSQEASRKFIDRVWGKRFFPNCQTFISQVDDSNQEKLRYLADQMYA